MDNKAKKICVKCYFNEQSFASVVADAEKAGKRRRGLQLFTQKEHSIGDVRVSNTDGISRFLKYCWQYWKEHESDRLREIAEVKETERQIQERKKRLGVVE